MIKGEYDSEKHAKVLYNMKLHETLKFSEELYVTRVPGGWIYDRTLIDKNNPNKSIAFLTSILVPFNGEFNIGDNPITAQEILEEYEDLRKEF